MNEAFTRACMALLLGTLFLAPPASGSDRKIEGSKRGGQKIEAGASPAEAKGKELSILATRIDEDLTRISGEHKSLLGSPWMRLALRYFGEAQLAASALAKGGGCDPGEVDRLHNNLDELSRALENLRKGHAPNTKQQTEELKGIERPSGQAIQKLEDALRDVKKLANSTPGLEEIALVKLAPDASIADAARYGLRVLDKIDVLLYARGFGQITGEGRRKTDETMKPRLLELRGALEDLLRAEPEAEGEVAEHARAPLGDRIARLKKALTEAEKTTDAFGNAFPGGRERLKLAGVELERLRGQVLKARAPRGKA